MSEVSKPEAAQNNTEAAQGNQDPVTESKPADAGTPAAPETKPEQDAPKDEPEAPKVAPEKYDLKLPENAYLAVGEVEKISVHARARGLSNEEAQAELVRLNSEVESRAKAQGDQWRVESESDKEIGGEALAQNVQLATRAISRFSTPQFMGLLDKYGFGNHPEVIRIFSRIGKAMGDDELVQPGSAAGGKRSIEEVFYGKKEA